MKRIFTPFSLQTAGTLTSRLSYVEDEPDGEYKGFKPDEYVYAPPKNGTQYVTTQMLSLLRSSGDQLYINGHCSKGLAYLANMEDCKAQGAARVEMDDLIAQFE